MLIGNLLFFLMMFAPQTWQSIKMPLVVLVVSLLVLYYIKNLRRKLNVNIITWFTLLLAFGVIWSFYGALKSNPGAADIFRVNVVWVVLYALFVFYLDSFEKFEKMVFTMVLATIAISLYNISIVLCAFHIIPDIYSVLKIDDPGNLIGVHEGFIQITGRNVGSLTFLGPFMLSSFILRPEYFRKVPDKLLKLAVVLSFIAILLAGRRALWVELMATPLLVFIFNIVMSDKKKSNISRKVAGIYLVMGIFLISLGYYLAAKIDWNFTDLYDRFSEVFVNKGDVRQLQSVALWNGFTESPILGSGFGIGVNEVVRDYDQPWNYELSYIQILYNTGLLGATLYFICLSMIYYWGYKSIKCKVGDK